MYILRAWRTRRHLTQKDENKMATKSAKNTKKTAIETNREIVEMYRELVNEVSDTNTAGLNFVIFSSEMIQRGEVSAREIRASIESVGKLAIAPVIKASHAEVLEVAAKIIMENASAGASDPLVSKVLSLATRVKRAGVEVKAGDTFESLDEQTPSASEIAQARKAEAGAEAEAVKVALPVLDALVVEFVANLKKATKGKLDTATLSDVSTPALEELKVLLGTLAKNRKASKVA